MKKSYILLFFISVISLFMMSTMQIYSEVNISGTLYNEGIRKYILKDYIGAIKDFESAYKINKKKSKIKKMYINALIKQGSIDYENNNLNSAKRHYSRAYILSGEDEDLQRKLKTIQEDIANRKEVTEAKITTKEDVAKETTAIATKKPILHEEKKAVTEKNVISQVQLPFDIEKFIQVQNEENKKILSDIIKSQMDERKFLFKNMQAITESQSQDRKYFSRSLILIIVGGIVIVIIIGIIMIILMRKSGSAIATPIINHQDSQDLMEYNQAQLLEYAQNIDETKYITNENYSEIVRAKRLGQLYNELQKGNLTWDTIQEYISELNHELKSEILNIVEKKINSNETEQLDNSLQILLSLVTSGDTDISVRSKEIAGRTSGSRMELTYSDQIDDESENESENGSDPLSISTLSQLARMADAKTGSVNHSINVATLSYKIAQILQNPDIDPILVKKAGLAHDIGYLEIDDKIFRKHGELTEKQFSIVKTHTMRGINLIQHANPSQIIIDGMKYHHERLDGSGYPEGLEGEEIPTISKIIAVADFFDAVTSPRPYREALSLSSSLEMMEKLSGQHFEERIVMILIEIYSKQMDNKA